MTVQISQPNFGGLGLAQGNTNLNLAPVGALGLQAIQVATANANARKQAELEQQRLGQQFVLQAQQQNILREQMAQQAAAQNAQQQLERQKLGMAGQQFGAELDYKNRALAQQGAALQSENELKQAALAQEYQQKQMARLMDMDKQALKDRGAMASYGLLALKNAKTPEEAAMIRSEWLKEAKDKKMVSDEEAELLAKSPLSKVQNLLMYDVMRTGQASELKQTMDAMAPAKDKSGVGTITLPDGTVIQTTEPSTAVKTEVQKKIIGDEALQRSFNRIEKGYDPNYFRYGNQMDTWIGKNAEKLKDTALGGVAESAANVITGMSPKEREGFIAKRTTFMNDVNQVFNQYRKEITGAAAAMQELDRLQSSFLSGEMSPSEFRGALDLVKERGLAEIAQQKKLMREGIDTSYDPALVSYLKGKGYSAEEISKALGGN